MLVKMGHGLWNHSVICLQNTPESALATSKKPSARGRSSLSKREKLWTSLESQTGMFGRTFGRISQVCFILFV